MWPDRVSNPGPPTYESGALPIALRGPAFLALVMLDKTYAGNRFCWTKPMPGIHYVEQNLFLAYIMLDKTYS